jgi:hypothetical protein
MEWAGSIYIYCAKPNKTYSHNSNEWCLHSNSYAERMYSHSDNECHSKPCTNCYCEQWRTLLSGTNNSIEFYGRWYLFMEWAGSIYVYGTKPNETYSHHRNERRVHSNSYVKRMYRDSDHECDSKSNTNANRIKWRTLLSGTNNSIKRHGRRNVFVERPRRV